MTIALAALNGLRSGNLAIALVAVCMLIQPDKLFAQEPPAEPPEESLKRTEGFFALPMELEFDSGAANGDASILRFMPPYSFPSFNKWKLVHLDLLTFADAPGGIPGQPGNPEPVPGNRVFGISI